MCRDIGATSRVARRQGAACRCMAHPVQPGGVALAARPAREGPVAQRQVALDTAPRQANLDAVEVAASARQHGISDADILHAWRNVLRVAEQDYGGESRVIAVGPARNGALLELVLVAADEPIQVIHTDFARRSFLDRMR